MSSAAMDTVESARTGRLLGFAVDFILLMIVTAVVWGVFFVLRIFVGIGGMAAAGAGDAPGAGASSAATTGLSVLNIGLSFLQWAIIAAVLVGYFTYFTTKNGQTIGKRITDVAVVNADGSTPSRKAALIRSAVLLAPLPVMALVSIFIPLIGPPLAFALMIGWLVIEAVVMFVSDDATRLGDKLAGTAVVQS